MILNVEDIKKILPHRYPFLFVDRVLEFNKDERTLKAMKNISANEQIFNGHFPNYAVFPGVLQVEMLAQSCGILSSLLNPELSENNALNLLVKVSDMKFKNLVIPGDTLYSQIKVQNVRGALWVYECKAFANTEDNLVSEGIISCYQKNLD